MSRTFLDSAGIEWTVWSTVPSRAEYFASDFQAGWLTFDSALERRRLAPIPADWQLLTDQRLEPLCRAAHPVRRPTPQGVNVVNEPDDPGR